MFVVLALVFCHLLQDLLLESGEVGLDQCRSLGKRSTRQIEGCQLESDGEAMKAIHEMKKLLRGSSIWSKGRWVAECVDAATHCHFAYRKHTVSQ